MFGNDILVAPKLEEPKVEDGPVTVTAYLPKSSEWFNFGTKMVETRSSPIT
jgi:alpha-glucosidase (family GH31 glycosyl hydrolase)